MYQLPDESRVRRTIQPANNWGWQEMLLNKAAYLLEVIAWQNTEDAHEGRSSTAPQLYTPPFLTGAITQSLDPNQEVHTTDDIKEILARPRG